MKQCPLCKIEFPERLISPLLLGESSNFAIIPSCPICALKHRNKLIGLPEDTKFSGPKANQLYNDALMYLKYKESKKDKNEN